MARPPAKTTAAKKAPVRPRRKAAVKPPVGDALALRAEDTPAGGFSAKQATAPPAGAADALRKRRVTITSLEQSSTRLRVVMLNLAFVGAFLLLVPVLASQFWENEVVIDPISVPDSLAAVGLTSDVVASRLWDGLKDAQENANTSKATVAAIPTSRRVKFSIPETGVSIESLVSQTRQFFHAYQTRVGGEFICATSACAPEDMQLRLRVIRDRATVIDLPPIGTVSERDYFAEAGVQVLSVLDPFVAVSATAEREPLKAVTLARQLIRSRHPDAHWAHNLIGNIRVAAGEYTLAAAEYRAALALNPEFRIARVNLANTLVSMGEVEEARTLFEALEARYPDDPSLRLGLAELAAQDGSIEEAVDLLLAGAALAPNDPQYFARAGQLESENGRVEAARTHLERALAIDPSFAPALGTLGNIHLSAGDYAAAEPLFGDMADFLPDDPEAQDLHAQTLMLINEPDRALERFLKADMLDPGNVDRLYAIAGALFFLDRVPEARARLEQALAIDPDRADIHALLGQFDLMSGDFESTLARYERAAELEPHNPVRWANLADALYYLGRVDDAIARLEELTRTAPERVETWFTLGNYYASVDRPEDSMAAYRTFLEEVPPDPIFDTLRALAEEGIAMQGALLPAGEDDRAP